MNVVFCLLIISSSIYLIVESPDSVMGIMMNGATRAAYFTLTLFSIYVVWMTVLNVLSKTKLDKGLSKLIARPIRRLFPRENEAAYDALALNLSANMLGMGGAATPAGIRAMENMQSRKNRIMLVVVNSTSIQLIPTTIIGMRADYDATTDIILASLITTFATTVIAILLVKIFVRE